MVLLQQLHTKALSTLIIACLFFCTQTIPNIATAQEFENTGNNPGNPNAPGYFGNEFVNTGNNPGNPNARGYFNITRPVSVPTTEPVVVPGGETSNNINNPSNPNAPGYYGGGTTSIPPPTPPAVGGGGGMLNALYGFVIALFGTMVGLAGYLLHLGVTTYVVGFGNEFLTSGVGVVVNDTWATVRDIFNLTFIFGLIYIGFRMILFTDDTQAKRTLGTLVLATLLVNFSLFFTKFIIDISNSLATVIYSAFSSTDNMPVNLADSFLTLLGLSRLLDIESVAMTFAAPNPGIGLAITFMSLIFFAVTAFVFAAGGILLIIRFIVLNFYMVFSPIMFLGWVFPGMAKYSTQYMSGFLRNAFMAPAYIFCLYFSYLILSGMNVTLTGDLGSIVNISSGTFDGSEAGKAIAYFSLGILLLLASMKIAKDMGAVGAGTALAFGNSARKYTQGAVTGFAGRNTVGRLASGAGKLNERLEGSGSGRFAKRVITYGSLGVLNERTRRNVTEAGKKAKFGGSYSREDDKNLTKDIKETRSRVATKLSNQKTIARGTAAQNKLNSGRTFTSAETAELQNHVDEMALISGNITQKQMEDMSDSQLTGVAQHLSDSQMESFLKNDKVADTTKDKVIQARQDAIKKLAGANTGRINEDFANLSIGQIETMSEEWIEKNAHRFTHSQFEEVKKSKKFTPARKGTFTAARKKHFDTVGNPSNTNARDFENIFESGTGYRKASDVAMLPANILLHPNSIPFIDDKVLKEIASKGSLSTTEQTTLKNQIQRSRVAQQKAKDYFKSAHAKNNWA